MQILTSKRYINPLFILAIILLCVCGFLVFHQMRKLILANSWVIHSYQIIAKTNHLQSLINDTESRISLYMLSKNPELIKNVANKIDEVESTILSLGDLMQDNPEQIKTLKNLGVAIKTKTDRMHLLINTFNQNQAAGIALAVSQQRYDLKLKIAELIKKINDDELSLLDVRTADLNKNLNQFNLVLLGSGALGLLMLFLSFAALNYHLKQRDRLVKVQDEMENELLIINENLRQSERRLQLATEGGNTGIWDWIPGTSAVYYSDSFKTNLGYSDEEFPNTVESFEKVIHPEDHNKVWELVTEHLEHNKPFNIEYRLKTKEGGYKWFRASGQSLRDKHGHSTRMSGFIIDITDSKKGIQYLRIQYAITRALIEAENLQEMAVKVIQIICQGLDWKMGSIWRKADKTSKQLYCLAYWQKPSIKNKEFETVTINARPHVGEGLIGKVWQEEKALWVNDVMEDDAFMRKDAAGKVGLHSAFYFPLFSRNKMIGLMEFFSHTKEPTDEPLVNLFKTIGFILEEFIQRELSKKQLVDNEKYKTAILESALDSIITIDERGEIISCNTQTTKIFNYSVDELLHKNIELLMPNFLASINDLLSRDVSEFTGVQKSGAPVPCEITTSKMRLDNTTAIVIVIRDITERKKIEHMKNEFISIVSHELRTPLTSIQGSLDLLADETAGPLSDDEKQLINIARNNSSRLIRLINDILDIQKIEAGKTEFKLNILELAPIVEEALTINESYAKKYNVHLKLVEPYPRTVVNVDRDKLLQALTNLISNAIKFSPENETVEVEIKELPTRKVRVSIRDKGPGVPKDFQPLVFQKFVQADSAATRKRGGTGLGLSITKAIIESLNGEINFITKEGKGSVFYFELPIANLGDTLAPSDERPTILICESDDETAKIIQNIFNQNNFNTMVTHTAAEAKKALSQAVIDALILDVVLPDQSGISLIKELRSSKNTYLLPVVVVSIAASESEQKLKGSALSVLDWIDKPIEQFRVVQAINHIRAQIDANTVKILYVEDDKDLITVIQKAIGDEAIIVSAPTIKEAFAILKVQDFDLVILDLLLPDGSGIELLPEFSKRHIPVIVFSAYEFPEDYAKYVKSALIKSKTSNHELLKLIRITLGQKTEEVGG